MEAIDARGAVNAARAALSAFVEVLPGMELRSVRVEGVRVPQGAGNWEITLSHEEPLPEDRPLAALGRGGPRYERVLHTFEVTQDGTVLEMRRWESRR